MNVPIKSSRKPAIVIGEIEHERLSGLASDAVDRIPEVAEELLAELDRARIVKAGKVPADTVQMGSTLEYHAEDGKQRTVTLVYPALADIDQGRLSVLTPIGVALIGLTSGQSIDWLARDGRRHRLTVVSVTQPATTAA